MTNRLKAVLVALASLVCCIPLILGIIGASTGVAGVTAPWFRRYDLAILAVIGLSAVVVLATQHRHQRADHRNYGGER